MRDGETDGWGLAASLEAGYPFHLGGNWILEPQAQLVYQALNISDFNDGAAEVRYSDTNSLAGRLGARLAHSWDLDEGQATSNGGEAASAHREASAWLRFDVWKEFIAQPTTEFSSANGFVPFTADLENSWMKIGLGGTYDFAVNRTVYANINYDRSFDGDADGWEGKLGLKVTW